MVKQSMAIRAAERISRQVTPRQSKFAVREHKFVSRFVKTK